jgi:hypothetical protein
LLTGFVVAGAIRYPRQVYKRQFALFALIAAFYFAAFSLIGFLPRYIMPVFPYLCIVSAWSILVIFRERASWRYAAVAASVCVFLTFYHARSSSGDFETNMEHEDAISVSERACAHVLADHSGSTVLADWPMSVYLQRPYLGYVRSPVPRVVEVTNVPSAQLQQTSEGGLLRDIGKGSPIAFVYLPIGASNWSEALRARAREEGLSLTRRFEQNGKFVEVWFRPGSTPVDVHGD